MATKKPKKAAKKTSAAKPAAAKAAPPAPESSANGANEEGTKSWYARMRGLPPAKRTEVLVRGIGNRLAKLIALVDGWPAPPKGTHTPTTLGADATKSIAIFADSLAKFPEDFEPPRKQRGPKTLEAGSVVKILDKARDKYADILDEKELVGLTVVAIAKGKVRVKSKNGTTLVLPRGHVGPEA